VSTSTVATARIGFLPARGVSRVACDQPVGPCHHRGSEHRRIVHVADQPSESGRRCREDRAGGSPPRVTPTASRSFVPSRDQGLTLLEGWSIHLVRRQSRSPHRLLQGEAIDSSIAPSDAQ